MVHSVMDEIPPLPLSYREDRTIGSGFPLPPAPCFLVYDRRAEKFHLRLAAAPGEQGEVHVRLAFLGIFGGRMLSPFCQIGLVR